MHVNDRAEQRTAGAVVRPPPLFLALILLGLALDRLLPLASGHHRPDAIHWIVAGSLIIAGFGLATVAIRNFRHAGTPVRRTEPTRALVTTGVHGWSRNPIYVGMFLIYGGIGVAARSAWMLVLTLPLALTMRYGIVAREEAYLEERFGDDYRAYKARVRRWL